MSTSKQPVEQSTWGAFALFACILIVGIAGIAHLVMWLFKNEDLVIGVFCAVLVHLCFKALSRYEE